MARSQWTLKLWSADETVKTAPRNRGGMTMLQKIWVVPGDVVFLSIAPAWVIDSEGDRVLDGMDDCPDVANPDQAGSENHGPVFSWVLSISIHRHAWP